MDTTNIQKLQREFYQQEAVSLARALLGKRLVHQTTEGIASGIIVETEAYPGGSDKGSHSYGNRRTKRTEIQFGPAGYAYVFLIYGMYCCFNVVASTVGHPEVVLVRALEPAEGIPLMMTRRKQQNLRQLCNGPGKLCQALGITMSDYGKDLCGDTLYLADGSTPNIVASPRINIGYAGEYQDMAWRFSVPDNPFVSR